MNKLKILSRLILLLALVGLIGGCKEAAPEPTPKLLTAHATLRELWVTNRLWAENELDVTGTSTLDVVYAGNIFPDDVMSGGTVTADTGVFTTSVTAADVTVTDDLAVTGQFAGTTIFGTGTATLASAVITGALTSASVSTTYLTSTGSLSLDGITISGGYKFGAASTVISGTLIAHGLATTPTVVLLTPASATGAITLAVQVMATNETSFTVGIEDPGTTIDTLYWLAGK